MNKPTMARQFRREAYLRLADTLKKTKPTRESIPGIFDTAPSIATSAMLGQWQVDCHAIADMLADQSAAFDRKQFLDNCGL